MDNYKPTIRADEMGLQLQLVRYPPIYRALILPGMNALPR